MVKHGLMPLGSLGLLLILWHLTATELASPLLPAPWTVFELIGEETQSGRLPRQMAATFRRLALGFSLSMTVGVALGILLGRCPRLDRFFDSWLTVALNIPALVSIILCYLWFGLNETAAIVAVFLNKVPNVIVTLREGTRQSRRALLEMAEVYQFGWIRTMRHVVWPPLFPYVMTAARTGLALIWKIVLVVELLGRSDGMGYQLHLYFQLFDVTGILGYSIAFILAIQGIEWGVLAPLDRWATRWQR